MTKIITKIHCDDNEHKWIFVAQLAMCSLEQCVNCKDIRIVRI